MAAVGEWIEKIGRQRLAAIAFLLLWVALIVVGAGPAADGRTWLGVPSFDWLNYVMFGLMALGAIAIVVGVIARPDSGERQTPKRKPLWPMLIALLAFALLLRRPERVDPGSVDAPNRQEPAPSGPADAVSGAGGVGGSELAALLVILAVAMLVIVVSKRRRGDHEDDEQPEEQLEAVITPAAKRAAEQLLTGTDPRSSVLLAYRNLESALESRDLAREVAETPSEHLRRVLVDLRLDTAPLLQLSELYQLARFSDHPISEAQQRAAGEALQQALGQLPIAGGGTS